MKESPYWSFLGDQTLLDLRCHESTPSANTSNPPLARLVSRYGLRIARLCWRVETKCHSDLHRRSRAVGCRRLREQRGSHTSPGSARGRWNAVYAGFYQGSLFAVKGDGIDRSLQPPGRYSGFYPARQSGGFREWASAGDADDRHSA